jgi:hypothetical protein
LAPLPDVQAAEPFLARFRPVSVKRRGPPRARYLFVEAAQIAAYNAPPFPAGHRFFGWNLRDSAMPHVAENSAERSGIFVAHRMSATTQ